MPRADSNLTRCWSIRGGKSKLELDVEGKSACLNLRIVAYFEQAQRNSDEFLAESLPLLLEGFSRACLTTLLCTGPPPEGGGGDVYVGSLQSPWTTQAISIFIFSSFCFFLMRASRFLLPTP